MNNTPENPSTSQQPMLSVVIPTFNNQATIARAIVSVSTQLDARSELIVINDGSTDATLSIINDLSCHRLILINQANCGAGHARNRGVERATGRWVLCLDADDALTKGSLSHLLEILEQNPQTDCLLGAATTLSTHRAPRRRGPGQLPNTPEARLKAYLLDKALRISHGSSVFLRQHLLAAPYAEHLQQSEDIPVFAYTLCQPHCLATDFTLAEIFRQPNSRRSNYHLPDTHAQQLCDAVFKLLPSSLHRWKNDYLASRLLSQARGLEKAGKYREAAALTYSTLHLRPHLSWRAHAIIQCTRQSVLDLLQAMHVG